VSIDLRLVAILDPTVLGGRDPVSAARAAQAGGATALQLRMKDIPAGEIATLAERLLAVMDIPLFINDRADVALAVGATGVHLGQDDVPAAALRAVSPPGFQIGLSVGFPDEAAIARQSRPDYWSIGPLYRTASKADAGVPLGPGGFARLASLADRDVPVIAIGGIDASNATAAIRAGAAGVAVISAIFSAADVEAAARLMRSAVDAAIGQGREPPGSRRGAP